MVIYPPYMIKRLIHIILLNKSSKEMENQIKPSQWAKSPKEQSEGVHFY